MIEGTAPGAVADTVPVDTELLRVGDRLSGFSVLLPERVQGTVLLAVSAGTAAALRGRFPGAVVVEAGPAGTTGPLPAPGSVRLLVVDDARPDVGLLRRLVTSDGVVATIGRRGRHVLYPDTDRPELVWRPGWPLPDRVRLGAGLRRDLGLWSARTRGVPRLEVTGPPFTSLAETIRRDLSRLLADELRLVGVVTAGHTVLRLRGRDDYAVRVSWVDRACDATVIDAVRRDVPAADDLLPRDVAAGQAGGHPWRAARWLPRRRTPVLLTRRAAGRRWSAVGRLADALGSAPRGRTEPGWARQWADAAHLLTDEARAEFGGVLARLDDGVPTGWCHGDPWPANVLLGRDHAVVIDWDNATPDAPLGLDHLLLAALRSAGRRRGRQSVAQALVRLVDTPAEVRGTVLGLPWPDLDRADRVALVLAAFVLHLRNRALHDLGQVALDAEVATMRGLLAVPAPPPPRRRVTGAARGALWLGTGAALVKGAQTVVLLLLAAILDPSALGVLAIGSLVLTVTSAVTDMGSSTALVYWRGDAERAARTALTIALAFAGVLTATGWLLAPGLAALTKAGPDGAGVIRGLLLALPFTAVSGVSGELLRRDLSFGRRVLPDITGAVVGAAVSIVLALHGAGVSALVVGQVVQAVVRVALCWAVRRPVWPGWRTRDAGRLLHYGRHLAGANLLQLLMLNVDYLLVGHVLGARALGEYSLAFRLAYMPYPLVALVIGGTAFAYLCRLRGAAVGRAASSVATVTITLLAPLHLGIVLLAPQIQLLGAQWSPAVPVLRWLGCYGLVLGFVNACVVSLNAVARTRDAFLVYLLHLTLLVVVLGVLARSGIVAVAVGQAAVVVLVAAFGGRRVRRHVPGADWSVVRRDLRPVLAGAALMTAVVIALQELMPWAQVSVPGLLLLGTAGLAAYVAPVALLGRERLRVATAMLEAAP